MGTRRNVPIMTPSIAGPSRTAAHSPVKLLNVADVRIDAAEICNQVEKLDDVAEAIRIGREWDDDVRGVLFVRLGDGPMLTPLLEQTIGARIRSRPRRARAGTAMRSGIWRRWPIPKRQPLRRA